MIEIFALVAGACPAARAKISKFELISLIALIKEASGQQSSSLRPRHGHAA